MLLRALFCLALAAPAFAESTSPEPVPAPATAAADTALMDTVLVTGEQPGPGLWKATKGEHVLWIFGTWSPLAANMEWRAKEAEERIAQSQQVLLAPKTALKVGFFRSLSLAPTVVGITRNGDGKKLADVLPPELYSRWEVLKARYLPENRKIERERPLFAAQELYHKAIAQSGLTLKNDAQKRIIEIARQHGIQPTRIDTEIKMENPRQALRDFKTGPRDGDLECLRATLDRIENDLGAMRQRANAWASGDLAGLTERPYVDQNLTCLNGMASTPGLRQRLDAAVAHSKQEWVKAVESALDRNTSTFAVASIGQLTAADGLLAQLRARGIRVEDPDQLAQDESAAESDTALE